MTSPQQPRSFGRYEVVRTLGRGAVGEVFLAKDPTLDRYVAVKTLSGLEALADEERQEAHARFFREARSAAALSHPNIVTIYDVGEEQGVPYIAMEWLDGITLDRHARKPHLLPIPKVLELGMQAAMALYEAHRAGIVHRDIKPANLILCEDGKLKVADFGLAKHATSALTSDQAVVGSPAYMAPEQVVGKAIDARADLFSLGVSLFELLTGTRPFAGDTVSSVLYRVVNDPAPGLTSMAPEAPADLEQLLGRMLAKSPEQRPESGLEVARALRGVLDQLGGVPEDLVLPEPAARAGEGASETERSSRAEAGREPSEGDGRRSRWSAPAGVRPALVAVAAVIALVALWLAPLWLGVDPLGSARRPVEAWLSATFGSLGDAVRLTTPLARMAVRTEPEGLELALREPQAEVRWEGRELVFPVDRTAPIWIVVDDPCREGLERVDPDAPPEEVVVATEPRTARFGVTSDPAGARLTVDGAGIEAPTPTEIELALCEAHTVTFDIEGRPERSVELSASGSPEAWEQALRGVSIAPPPKGKIVFETSPHYPVAVLSARDGRRLGAVGEPITLPPGAYRVLLVNSEVLLRKDVTVKVTPGGRRTVPVSYPALGTLRVISVPPGARVEGRATGGQRYFELGRTPLTGRRVVAGEIELRVVHPESGEAAVGAVSVAAGEAETDVRVAAGTGWKITAAGARSGR